jgi:hypothetical protein
MLVRFSGDPSSLASVFTLGRWLETVPESIRRRLRIAALVDKHAHVSAIRLPIVLDSEQSATRSLQMTPGSLVILDSGGTVAWTQSSLSMPRGSAGSASGSAGLVRLGAIVGDLLDGVDVPARMRQQWVEQVATYRRVLTEESVSNK